MAGKKDDKTPSAEEVIDQLAEEMGVEEESDSETTVEEESKDASADEETPEAEPEAEETPEAEPEAEETPEAEPEAEESAVATKTHNISGVDEIFNLTGENEHAIAELPDDGNEDAPSKSSLKLLGMVAGITAVLLLCIYTIIPDQYRGDIGKLAGCYPPLSFFVVCVDLQEERRIAREEAERERLRIFLESAPKYGTLTVSTRPGYSLFQVDGEQKLVEHPNTEGVLVETRSGTVIENLDVTEQHVVTIMLPNYGDAEQNWANRRIELPPWGTDGTLWQQRQTDATYYLELNEVLTPVPTTQPELIRRMTPTLEELAGQITVRTNPEGARIFYNGRPITTEDGEPALTPHTFTSYRPRPTPPDPEQGQTEPVEREPLPVVLSGQGVPIRIEMDGYMPVITGVHKHMYTCNPLGDWGAATPEMWLNPDPGAPPLMERCQYTYDTGTINLLTPEQFAPPEEEAAEGETAEGEGEAAEGETAEEGTSDEGGE